MIYEDFLDFETMQKLRDAAPDVRTVPADVAKLAVKALVQWMESNQPNESFSGDRYWTAQLSDLRAFMPEVTSHKMGAIYRSCSLPSKRTGSGYQVSWSAEQVVILKSFLGVK